MKPANVTSPPPSLTSFSTCGPSGRFFATGITAACERSGRAAASASDPARLIGESIRPSSCTAKRPSRASELVCVTFFHVTRAPVRVDTATEVPSNFSVTDSPAVPDIQWQRVSFPARWISGYQFPFISTCEWRGEMNSPSARPAASAANTSNAMHEMSDLAFFILLSFSVCSVCTAIAAATHISTGIQKARAVSCGQNRPPHRH